MVIVDELVMMTKLLWRVLCGGEGWMSVGVVEQFVLFLRSVVRKRLLLKLWLLIVVL